ncbi:N-acetylglucosamine-6-phosphate deacetylase [Leucobacter sp. HY1908]
MTATVIHSVRLLTGREDTADTWVLLAAGRVASRGSGSGWRAEIEALPDAAAVEVVDGSGHMLVPGFIDMHCHGAGGASFGDAEPGAIENALAVHRSHGTTRAVLSLVTAPIEVLEEQVARIRDLTGRGLGVLGSHLEGPFLAEEFKGAHDPALLRAATKPDLDRLIAAGSGTIAQVTLAPELPGGMAAIEQFVAAGVRVAVGHTAADYDASRAAFVAGATILTHAFNGMKGIHHRAPGPVLAAMAEPQVTLELINDGVHVHPDVVRLAFAGAPGRVALITDAMAATCCADGRYMLGSLEVDVEGGVARLAGGTSIAGSTLTLDGALRQAVRECGVPMQTAIASLTEVPARALGVSDKFGDLAVGYAADAVLLDDALEVAGVWADGVRAAS